MYNNKLLLILLLTFFISVIGETKNASDDKPPSAASGAGDNGNEAPDPHAIRKQHEKEVDSLNARYRSQLQGYAALSEKDIRVDIKTHPHWKHLLLITVHNDCSADFVGRCDSFALRFELKGVEKAMIFERRLPPNTAPGGACSASVEVKAGQSDKTTFPLRWYGFEALKPGSYDFHFTLPLSVYAPKAAHVFTWNDGKTSVESDRDETSEKKFKLSGDCQITIPSDKSQPIIIKPMQKQETGGP